MQKQDNGVSRKTRMLDLHIINPGVEFSWRHLRRETPQFRWRIQEMKKVLLITILGTLLSVTAGCRFLDCLCQGGPTNQTCQAATDDRPVFREPCSGYSSGGCEYLRQSDPRDNQRHDAGTGVNLRPSPDIEEANYEETIDVCRTWNIARRIKRLPHRRMLALRLEFPLPSRAKCARPGQQVMVDPCCDPCRRRSDRGNAGPFLLPLRCDASKAQVHRATAVPLLNAVRPR